MQLRGWLRRKVMEGMEAASAKSAFQKEIEDFELAAARRVIVLPSVSKMSDIDIKYELIPPFTFAHIRWDDESKTLVYDVIEPSLNERQKAVYDKLEEEMAKVLESDAELLSGKGMLDYIKERTKKLIVEHELSLEPRDATKIMYSLFVNFVGLNEIEPIMRDPFIEDIGCDGVGIPVYIVHKKYGSLRTSVVFKTTERLRNFVIKIAERSGRYVSYAEPMLDGTLPDGSRVQATLASDVTTRGPTFSIRKFRAVPYSAVDLIKMGTASAEEFAYLWFLVEYKKNIMIIGGTAAGKTSFLNSLVSFIPPEDKIISIEDTRELNIPHQNWIPAVTRTGFGAETGGRKYGEITMFDLLKESFRQKPDYVIVGEVRGKEAAVLFQGMASGHPSFGTMHAGSVEEIIQRLSTPPISLPPTLIGALDIVIVVTHVLKQGKSARRLKNINEIQTVDPSTNRAITTESFTYHPLTDEHIKGHTVIMETIGAEYGMTSMEIEREIALRTAFLNWMLDRNVVNFDEVSKYITQYYKEKDRILKLAGLDKMLGASSASTASS